MCLLCICRQELPSNYSEKKIQEATAILTRDVALTKEFQGCSITDYKVILCEASEETLVKKYEASGLCRKVTFHFIISITYDVMSGKEKDCMFERISCQPDMDDLEEFLLQKENGPNYMVRAMHSLQDKSSELQLFVDWAEKKENITLTWKNSKTLCIRLDIASEEHGKSFLEFEWGIVISSSAANYVWDYALSGNPAAFMKQHEDRLKHEVNFKGIQTAQRAIEFVAMFGIGS